MASPKTPKNGGAGWRGREQDEAENIQHRWQSAETTKPADQLPVDGRGRRIAFGILIIAALVLLGFYIRYLLLAPVQTPVLFLSSGPYSAPFAPNSWSREDAAGIYDALNEKTLEVSRVNTIEEFRTQLTEKLGAQKRSNVVVIAISMHGAVNEEGEPCLIPPGASAVNSKTWIKLEDVFTWIRKSGLSDRTRKLLILDCNRVRRWWPQGTLHNSFADQLPDAVKKADVPNLFVLNSVSTGQRGWTSTTFQGSVFGHYLTRGIAGKADENDDRSVTLQELFRYVRGQVDRWATHHRGEHQQPLLIGSDGQSDKSTDFHVAYAYRGTLPAPKSSKPAVSDEQLAELWKSHDNLQSAATYRFDPLTWQTFQQKLIRLDAVATAGDAYQPAAVRLYNDLVNLKKRLETQSVRIKDPNSLYANFRTFTRDSDGSVDAKTLHNLALAQLLGGIDSPTVQNLRTWIDVFAKTPTGKNLQKAVTEFRESSAATTDDARFLGMLNTYKVLGLWQTPSVVADLLMLRKTAAEASVSWELRTHSIVRSAVSAADRKRRVLEDRIFVGQASAPPKLVSDIKSATTDYKDANSRIVSLRKAFHLQDRVLAELPWLLAWLSHPAVADNKEIKNEEINRLVAELMTELRRLGRALETGQSLSAPTMSVEKIFRDLSAHYAKECQILAKTPARDIFVLRRIEAVLSVPLVPAGVKRKDLKDAAIEISKTTSRNFNDGKISEKTIGKVSSLQAARRWKVHPGRYLLSRPSIAAKDGEKQTRAPVADDTVVPIHKLEGTIRARLVALTNDIRNLSNQPAESDEDEFRRACRSATTRWRFALAFPMPSTERDPVHFLRLFDLQRLLVWQSRRTLQDFWGRAEKPTVFFADAARAQLDAAQSVFQHYPGFDKDKQSIDGKLREWRNPKAPVFTMRAGTESGIDPTAAFSVSMRVTQESGLSILAGETDLIRQSSAGIANVSLWDENDNRVGTTVRPVPVSPNVDGATVTELVFPVNPQKDMSAGSSLWVKTVFRGHEFTSNFKLNVASGVVAQVRPKFSNRSSVTVRGSAAKPLSIVFVLDCSHSMSKRVKGGSRKTRHRVAVAALKSMLAKLAERGNSRVSVIFYGHRVAWNASKPSELLRQTDYARKFPDELLPLEDVEPVLPLGRFDARVSKRIDRLLTTVKPWGETPLYLAIDEALRQFAGETGAGERSIVVITDGVNNQRVPKDLKLTKAQSVKVTSRSDLERAIRRRPIPVHILGFEMDSTEERGARNDFRKIADQSQGKYFAAVAADSLLSKLASLLGPAEFQLIGSGSKLIDKTGLGKRIVLDVPSTGPAAMSVVSGSAKTNIVLQGGEALELLIGADGTSIDSIRYVKGDPKFIPLFVDPKTSAKSGMEIGLHAASRTGDDVEFTVSIQRTDRGFSRRLPVVWIKVTPMSATNRVAGKPYFFYDTAYVPEMPVPVLKMRAVNWPAAASRASFEIWCQPHPIDSEIVPLAKLLGGTVTASKAAAGAKHLVSGWSLRAGIDTSGKRVVLRITQQADGKRAKTQPLGSREKSQQLKIAFSGVQADRITRQFDTENGIVLHKFEFANVKEAMVRSGELRISTLEAVRKSALQFAEPATVDVGAKEGLLPLTPPLRVKN